MRKGSDRGGEGVGMIGAGDLGPLSSPPKGGFYRRSPADRAHGGM